MNRFKQLTQKRADRLARAKELAEKVGATPEESAEADLILKSEIPAIDAELARLDAIHELERKAPAVALGATVTPRIEQDPMRGFASAAEFARTVFLTSPAAGGNQQVDPRLAAILRSDKTAELDRQGIGAAPTNFHNEGHSNDGYLVPPAVAQRIFELVFAQEGIFSLTDPEPIDGNSAKLNADETTPWGATGVQAYWTAEGGQLTKSRLAGQERETKIHKLAAYVLATEEVLADASLLERRATVGAANAIEWKASEAVIRGIGAGQPLGYETSPAVISVAKETSQAADTILPKNILKMFSRLLQTPGAKRRWLANSDIVPQLVDLRIGNEPSWVGQNQGLASAPGGMLLGIPILFSEHARTLGDQGDLALVDFAGYHSIMRKGGLQYASSIHLFFDYQIEAFRWTFRIGGQPYLSAPVSPANGSNTKSHFVLLDARA